MIKNVTQNTMLAKKTEIGASVNAKAIGLMFSRKIKDKGLVFVFDDEAKRDLHMFFVFYPIDVLFLDKRKKVAELKENFRPFTLYIARKKAQYVIELPAGTIRKSKTTLGNKITF